MTHIEARLLRKILSLFFFAGLACCFQACRHSSQEASVGAADRIVITKSARSLTLINGSRVLKTYHVALGRNPIGEKTRAGDHRTPEGEYIVDSKKSASRFFRALHLSYPNETDRARARELHVNPGGNVEIHGIENGLGWIGSLHQRVDWTDGCIAVTDSEIDEIWKAVPVGTKVEIRP